MKKRLILWLLLALLLTACGEEKPPQRSTAGRMVQTITVELTPKAPELERTYTSQERMNEILGILRDLPTDEDVTEGPDLNDGQAYYTITVSFANGEQRLYHLLGHSWLRMGQEPWTHVDLRDSMAFTEYLREHPSDNGDAPAETTAPAPTETTAPAPTE